MKSKKDSPGFTVIELIVVIAIIAVLAGIMLSNVTQYIKKGRDTAIKGQISQIRTVAADFFSANGTYSGMCSVPNGTKCLNIRSNVSNLGGSLISNNIFDTSYCADFYLSDQSSKWCVDNTGYVGPNDSCALLHIGCN